MSPAANFAFKGCKCNACKVKVFWGVFFNEGKHFVVVVVVVVVVVAELFIFFQEIFRDFLISFDEFYSIIFSNFFFSVLQSF